MCTTRRITAQDLCTGDVTAEYGRIVKATLTQGGIQVRYVQYGHRRQVTLAPIRRLTLIAAQTVRDN